MARTHHQRTGSWPGRESRVDFELGQGVQTQTTRNLRRLVQLRPYSQFAQDRGGTAGETVEVLCGQLSEKQRRSLQPFENLRTFCVAVKKLIADCI